MVDWSWFLMGLSMGSMAWAIFYMILEESRRHTIFTPPKASDGKQPPKPREASK